MLDRSSTLPWTCCWESWFLLCHDYFKKKKSRFVFVVYLPQILNNIVSTDFHAEWWAAEATQAPVIHFALAVSFHDLISQPTAHLLTSRTWILFTCNQPQYLGHNFRYTDCSVALCLTHGSPVHSLLCPLSLTRNNLSPDKSLCCFVYNPKASYLWSFTDLEEKICSKTAWRGSWDAGKGKLPQRWKEVIVLPICKPGKNCTKPQNYQPISLTFNICKIIAPGFTSLPRVHSNNTNNINICIRFKIVIWKVLQIGYQTRSIILPSWVPFDNALFIIGKHNTVNHCGQGETI